MFLKFAEVGCDFIVRTDKWLCGDCHLTIMQSPSQTGRQIRRWDMLSLDRHLCSFNTNSDVKM